QDIEAGESIDFHASAYDEHGNLITDNDLEFVWKNTSDSGLFDKTTAGKYNVTATYNDTVSDKISVNINPGPVDSIETSPKGVLTIKAGTSIEFEAWANDSYGNVITDDESDFTWENATEGVFDETEAGTYDVWVKYGGMTEIGSYVKVRANSTDRVEIEPSEDLNVKAGESVEFKAWAYDEYGNLITDNVTNFVWENANEGVFYQESVGIYTVTAAYDSVVSEEVNVTVEHTEVSEVNISPSENKKIKAGRSINFDAEALDEYGNLITDDDSEFTWENASKNGVFSKITADSYIVSADYKGTLSSTVKVNVKPAEASTIEITPSSEQEIDAGETIDFNASAYDEYGNLITDDDTEFTWLNTDLNGIFNKTNTDDYTVTAEYNSVSSNAVLVTVEPAEVNVVSISPSETQKVKAGESIDFDAKAYDEYGNLITDNDSNFTWTNASDGGFHEESVGVYTVTAAYDLVVSEEVKVTVKTSAADTVEIYPTEKQNTTAGNTIDFNASAYDEYGNLITDNVTNFMWKNTSEGVFYEESLGVYTVTATYDSVVSEEVKVTVQSASVSTVEINPSEKHIINAGEIIDFSAKALDEYGNLITDDDSEFTWENTDNKGVFEKTTEGEYIIATSYKGNTSNSVSVIVKPGTVLNISIEPSKDQTIIVGEKIDFSAEAYDKYGNMITDHDTDFNWKNTEESGIFDNTEPGDYQVKASYESASSSTVTVTLKEKAKFELSELRIDPDTPVVGEKSRLKIDVNNKGDISGEYTVKFKIDGEVVGTDTVEVDPGKTKTASVEYEFDSSSQKTLTVEDNSIKVNAENDPSSTFWLIMGVLIALALGLSIIGMKKVKKFDKRDKSDLKVLRKKSQIFKKGNEEK
ncbi:MAG: hypothetical protein ACOC40_02315, partial [Thermoplasmatota archaeon]